MNCGGVTKDHYEPIGNRLGFIPPFPNCKFSKGAVLTAVVYYNLTNEERDMLLRIAMAEVGCEDCVDCLALVMRTVLNRVESPLFPNRIYKVIHAENQFSPVASGSFTTAKPNDKCHEALDLVINGWDESKGALYFEACAGPSWHSRNLERLFQHCSTRFYK